MKYFVLIPLLLLMGCGGVDVDTVTDVEDMAVVMPSPVVVKDVEFVVHDGMACLTGRNYANLSENMSELERYIRELRVVIDVQ